MSGIISDVGAATAPAAVLVALAVLAVAAAVKLMDDAVDLPADRDLGRPNWALLLGRASTPYALLLFALAAALDAPLAVALFCAAYVWGMAGTMRERTPAGLPGIAEAGLALALAVLAAGAEVALFALALVGAAELLDDVLDRPRQTWRRERMLAGLALALLALALRPLPAAAGAAAAALFVGPLRGPRRARGADAQRGRRGGRGGERPGRRRRR